ncbi:MAG: PilZ domain-containing protein [Planctomycetes bacterium]|nr:PilZ domain-containing protein [Planctomycetota bacterium]
MSTMPASPTAISKTRVSERRFDQRTPITCNLWMIDHHGSTVLKCHCTNMSKSGMRLRVPLGYGITGGQRYELRSHLPGEQAEPGFNVVGSRWATVVWTEMQIDAADDHLAIGVALDPTDAPLTWSVSADHVSVPA